MAFDEDGNVILDGESNDKLVAAVVVMDELVELGVVAVDEDGDARPEDDGVENVVVAVVGASWRVEFAVVAVDEDDDVKPDDEGIDNVVAAETLDRDLDVGGYAEPVGGLAG